MTSENPDGGTPAEDLLRKARGHYALISTALEHARETLNTSETADVKKVADLLRDHWKAFQTTLDLEANLEKRNRERAGIVHGYALDLDQARTEVGRRLACLKASAAD